METYNSKTLNKKVTIPDEEIDDELNPEYLFSLTSNNLLIQIINGEVDPIRLAHKQLAARGLDNHSKWVGFKVAETIHSKPTIIEQLREISKRFWHGDEVQPLLEKL